MSPDTAIIKLIDDLWYYAESLYRQERTAPGRVTAAMKRTMAAYDVYAKAAWIGLSGLGCHGLHGPEHLKQIVNQQVRDIDFTNPEWRRDVRQRIHLQLFLS